MIALVSIKPKYADLILSGEKTIELRKMFNHKINRVYLYASSPVKRIVAVFDCNATDFQVYNNDYVCELACVSLEEYCDYFRNSKTKWFISPYDVKPINKTLADIGLKRPPQNYQFLNAAQIKILEMNL